MKINWEALSSLIEDRRGKSPKTETRITFYNKKNAASGAQYTTAAVRVSEQDVRKLGWAYGDKIRGFHDESTGALVFLKAEAGTSFAPYNCTYKGLEGQVGMGDFRHPVWGNAQRLVGVVEWDSYVGFRDDTNEPFLCFRPVAPGGPA